MDRVRNLLEQIRNRLEELNKAEKKVAEVILLNPQQATRFSIAARRFWRFRAPLGRHPPSPTCAKQTSYTAKRSMHAANAACGR